MKYNLKNTSTSLKELYKLNKFRPQSFKDVGDFGFITVNLIERSIVMLSDELSGLLLDVGCGEQPYLCYFNHLENKLACDYDANRGKVDFSCAADEIPLSDKTLDSILCTEVLEHVKDPLAVWNEFYRILKPGGRVLLTTPTYWPTHEVPHDYFRYPEYGLRRLVSDSGFDLLAIVPRGGAWAMLGQVSLHVMQKYFPFRWQRLIWNKIFLKLDSFSKSPRISLGWTILAVKKI